jgi:hypothetical protein
MTVRHANGRRNMPCEGNMQYIVQRRALRHYCLGGKFLSILEMEDGYEEIKLD